MEMVTDALTTSQFPVFTLYVQKNCLKVTPSADPTESVTDGRGALRLNANAQRLPTSRAEPVGAQTICDRAWSFERVQGYELETLAKRRKRVPNRQACEELCLGERGFICRCVLISHFSFRLPLKHFQSNQALITIRYKVHMIRPL